MPALPPATPSSRPTPEVLRRRRLGPEAHRVATAMGLVFIGVLFVFLMYSDVTKWVTGKPLQ